MREEDSSDEDMLDEEEYDSMRETNITLSSQDSSLFPLLDNMTEDDLAREIERRYNPQYTNSVTAALLHHPPHEDQKTPLIGSAYTSSRGW